MTDIAPSTADSAAAAGLSRRTIIAGAAWSVPAIVAVSATPAFAVSGAPTLTVTSPNMQAVAAGTTPVSTRVVDDGGQPLAGRAVALTGPSGTSFSPATPTTDGAGTATTTMTTSDPWATPGSSLTVTATTDGGTTSAALTLLGANAYAVGYNWAGQLGTPVDGNTESVPTPAQLSLAFPSPIRSLSAGNGFSIALLDDGTVWAIGDNSYGVFGDGTQNSRQSWAPVPGLSGVTQIAVSSATVYALLPDGTVSAWGNNSDGYAISGQLGTNSAVLGLTPTTVPGVTGATQIAAGSNNGYALLANGEVRAWGKNHLGQIGNGLVNDNVNPATTVLEVTGATQIAVTRDTAYALVSGTVYGWGYGGEGQLTDTTSDWENPNPRALNGISGATAIAAGGTTGYALVGGEVKAWGAGNVGQLGNNATANAEIPVTVSGLTGVTSIAGTGASAYALSPAGLSAWGNNDSGQLGDGTYTNRNAPITVQNTADVTTLMPASNTGSNSAFFVRHRTPTLTVTSPDMRTVAAGTTPVTAALTDSVGNPGQGTVISWNAPSGTSFSPSSSTTGTSGDATSTLITTDTWATPGSTVTVAASGAGVTASAALTVLGANAYAVGANGSRQLGTGSTAGSVSTPEQLSLVFPSPIKATASGNAFSLALLNDGTVWAIGDNSSGQLGEGTTTSRPTWAPIAGLTGVTQIAAGPASAYAVQNGTVLAWGANGAGQLGFAGNVSLTPTAVPGVSGATQVTAGASNGYALVTNGAVFAWGNNAYSQLGNGDFDDSDAGDVRYTATPVVGVVGATQIAAAGSTGYALVSGSVYAWGYGGGGQLGNGTTEEDWMSPQAITGLSFVTAIAAGGGTGYAVTGGQVKAWGYGDSGQLGNGTTNSSLTIVPVTGLTGVTAITATATSAYAVADGRLFAWGANGAGQLGNGTTTTSTTPVGVGNTADVTDLSNNSSGSDTAFFIR